MQTHFSFSNKQQALILQSFKDLSKNHSKILETTKTKQLNMFHQTDENF
jgi:hypothetical protein